MVLLGSSMHIPTHWSPQTPWCSFPCFVSVMMPFCAQATSFSFPLSIPRLSSHHIPSRFLMWLVMVVLGEPHRHQMSTACLSIQRGTNDIPRHRAHVMLNEDTVIDLARTVVIGSQWMRCCAIRDWVWSEIHSRRDEQLCCWRDETIRKLIGAGRGVVECGDAAAMRRGISCEKINLF